MDVVMRRHQTVETRIKGGLLSAIEIEMKRMNPLPIELVSFNGQKMRGQISDFNQFLAC